MKLKRMLFLLLLVCVFLVQMAPTALAAAGDPCCTEGCDGVYDKVWYCSTCQKYRCADAYCTGTLKTDEACSVCGRVTRSSPHASTSPIRVHAQNPDGSCVCCLIRADTQACIYCGTYYPDNSNAATMLSANGGTGMLFTGVLAGLIFGVLGTLLVQHVRRNKKK